MWYCSGGRNCAESKRANATEWRWMTWSHRNWFMVKSHNIYSSLWMFLLIRRSLCSLLFNWATLARWLLEVLARIATRSPVSGRCHWTTKPPNSGNYRGYESDRTAWPRTHVRPPQTTCNRRLDARRWWECGLHLAQICVLLAASW